MRVIVTGGAGFVGSHLVDALVNKGYEVIIFDDLSTGKKENINPKAKFYKIDISGDYRKLVSLANGVNWVFHLAAWARIQRSIDDVIGTNKANVTGILNILQMCREIKAERLIYSSSSSVYGDQKDYVMKETMILRPKSPYALQKLIGEKYCDMYSKLFNMKIISLRYFNVYGERQLTEGAYALVVGKFMEMKKKNKPLTIYGDGTQTRAYTHISDVVRANILAAETAFNLQSYHYIFNIGTGEETSVNKIAEMIGGFKEYIIPNPRGEFEEKRKVADYKKAKRLLFWEPKVKIKQGIEMLLNK